MPMASVSLSRGQSIRAMNRTRSILTYVLNVLLCFVDFLCGLRLTRRMPSPSASVRFYFRT